MQAVFTKHVNDKNLFSTADQLLLAVSGGVDSVVLAHLLKFHGAHFTLAHCNFKLRGRDSDADEDFCRDLALQLGVNIYVNEFDVKSHCSKHKVSVQMAARDLRYHWFDQLITEHHFNFLLTAHHASDSIETLFINLLRGTGINGLKGVPEKSGNKVRPLLPFLKDTLVKFANDHSIRYRNDKSNEEEKYERNVLRLSIIPALKNINPGLEQTLLENIRNFKEEAEIVDEFLNQKVKEILTKKDQQSYIDKSILKKEKHKRSVLHHVLGPWGFNDSQLADIIENITHNGLTGKTFRSNTHELVIDRNYIIVKPLIEKFFLKVMIQSLEDLSAINLLSFKRISSFTKANKNEIILDTDRLIFPLTIRNCLRGDKFRPFGMSGFKLLSDYFKDEKLNKFEKENCKLLVNGNGEIIWVIGYRTDDRYKTSPTEKNLIKLTLN